MVSRSNLTAPAAQTECGTDNSCKVCATIPTLHAVCNSKNYPHIYEANPEEIQFTNSSERSLGWSYPIFKSELNPEHNVTLIHLAYANFSSSYI